MSSTRDEKEDEPVLVPEDEEEFEVSDERCQAVIVQFVELTQTDEALAQFYLQDRNWNLQRSVNDYFNDNKAAKRNQLVEEGMEDEDADDLMVIQVINRNSSAKAVRDVRGDKSDLETKVCASGFSGSQAQKLNNMDMHGDDVEEQKEYFRFVTYNIDGINEKNLRLRTEAVCAIIKKENADVVLLQEVVPTSEMILRAELEHMTPISGRLINHDAGYFTMMFLKRGLVQVRESNIIHFKETLMGRNLSLASVTINHIPLTLINTHLESTKDFASTRIEQLKTAFDLIKNIPQNESVIMAGDLNMRDKELESLGGLPKDIHDVWITTGRRKECEFTWDMTRNDNLMFQGRNNYKPRCRFDRIYLRPSNPVRITPKHFGLIGIERLKPHVCFPSDHWGLICTFNIK